MTKKVTCARHLRTKRMLSLLLSVFISGCCATLQIPKYSAKPFDQYQYSQVKDGLAIAIHPLVQKEEMEKYFKADLSLDKMLAVFVTIENRTTSSSYLISKDHFSLGKIEAGVNIDSENTQLGDVSKAQAIGTLGAFVLTPILVPISASMISDAGTIRHNFIIKEIKTKTLSPGMVMEGFVYFKLPEKENSRGQLTLGIKIIELKTEETKTINISFNLETK